MTDEESLARGISYVNQYFFGRHDDSSDLNWTVWAYGIINTVKTLHFIDSTAQDILRSIGSGKLGDARYRITYEDLTKAGYRSLVHDYYHHEPQVNSLVSWHRDSENVPRKKQRKIKGLRA